jgi:hypothetical protein
MLAVLAEVSEEWVRDRPALEHSRPRLVSA